MPDQTSPPSPTVLVESHEPADPILCDAGLRWVRYPTREPPSWELQSTSLSTVWDNGVWHTWDARGIGGENASDESVEAAKVSAEAALLRQERHPIKGWMPHGFERDDCPDQELHAPPPTEDTQTFLNRIRDHGIAIRWGGCDEEWIAVITDEGRAMVAERDAQHAAEVATLREQLARLGAGQNARHEADAVEWGCRVTDLEAEVAELRKLNQWQSEQLLDKVARLAETERQLEEARTRYVVSVETHLAHFKGLRANLDSNALDWSGLADCAAALRRRLAEAEAAATQALALMPRCAHCSGYAKYYVTGVRTWELCERCMNTEPRYETKPLPTTKAIEHLEKAALATSGKEST